MKGRTSPKRPKESLPPAKRTELYGLVLLVVGLLLAFSLGSYHPLDPSFLSSSTEPRDIENLVGPLGAEVAAVAFEVAGIAVLMIPVMVLVAGWRRFRRQESQRVVGRGVGAVILLLSVPALLDLGFEDILWRGESVSAGGFVGRTVAQGLDTVLSSTGTFFVLVGLVLVGLTLLVQSSLGDFLALWRDRWSALWQRWTLGWTRRKERKGKEKVRRGVVAKHLEQAARERRKGGTPKITLPQAEVDSLPLRVSERKGAGGFSVRKVRVPPETAAGKKTATKSQPQKQIPFPSGDSADGDIPPLNLLQLDEIKTTVRENELVRMGELIRSRCQEFGVEGTIEGISPGPIVTIFEFQPAPGVKVSQIVGLQDDLALVLKAESVRIDRLPGRSTLGIEVPNDSRALIHLGNLLAKAPFNSSRSPLTMALGTTIHGEPYCSDLAKMPHVLVAGATGSGKSVGLQSMITSILYKATRDEVQFIFIDPKRIELGVYAQIPHLKAEVVVEPKRAANALRWAVAEMERRYRLLAEVHVRSIEYYNQAIRDPKVRERLSLSDSKTEVRDEDMRPLPYYVIVIDELADLMMVASAEVETSIARLAQMARAVGIHLIVATQRPSVDVLTGTIKANFPCRISFATASRHDSRTILDQVGSEKLLGKGDMLFMAPGTSRVIRLHGAYVSEQETAALVRWLKKRGRPQLDPAVLAPPKEEASKGGGGGGDDEMFDTAARLVVAERQGSASFLQRRLRIGFSRAARLIDMMEQDGLLGPPQGSKPREVLVKRDYFEEVDRARDQI